MAIINIDRFSDINDVYGITIGDAILSGYAHWLKRMIAAEPHISLYKMGSDEYALVYEECNDLSYCIAFLDRLIAMTQKESFVIEGIEIVLTITVGIAPASERVLEHATAALKEAKRKRRSLEVFSYEVKQEQGNNIAWYKRIKEAVEESRIVPFFQPIVDNATGRIIKYEALIRLIDTEGKVVSPYLFLEIAKKTKIYPELTKIMIDKVIARFKGSELPVSLNLSTQDLINPELADYLESTIMREGMGRLIIFEILESEGFENYDAVSAFVDRFKSIGCRFAIDDFGTGYSNFDHLLKLNVDTIKIDGTIKTRMTGMQIFTGISPNSPMRWESVPLPNSYRAKIYERSKPRRRCVAGIIFTSLQPSWSSRNFFFRWVRSISFIPLSACTPKDATRT